MTATITSDTKLSELSDELFHHGVKGMRWGVRRYQNLDGSLTRAGKQRVKNRRSGKKVEDYIKSGKIKTKDLEHYTVGELTTMTTAKGEKYVSGLMHGHDFDWQEMVNSSDYGLTPPAEIARKNYEKYGHYGKYQFSEDDSIYERSIRHGKIDDYSMRKCNPEYGNRGTTQNCAKCSATLELAGRGMNFMAGRQSYPSSVDAEAHWFKGAKRLHMDTDITEDAIKSFGKKTSGTLSIQYPDSIGGGHAMHWTVDDNGSFEIQDGQNGKRFSSLSSMMKEYGADSTKGLDVFRLDNCEPNWDNLAADSVVRDPDGARASYNKVKNKFSERVVDTW